VSKVSDFSFDFDSSLKESFELGNIENSVSYWLSAVNDIFSVFSASSSLLLLFDNFSFGSFLFVGNLKRINI